MTLLSLSVGMGGGVMAASGLSVRNALKSPPPRRREMKTIAQRLTEHLEGDGTINDGDTDMLYREAHKLLDDEETDLETVEQWAMDTVERYKRSHP